MDRLTEKSEDGVNVLACNQRCREDIACAARVACRIEQAAIDRLAEYEDTGLTPEEIIPLKMACGIQSAAMNAMSDVWKAQQDGCLIVLPCKVGDTVYWPIVDDVTGEQYVSADTISEVGTCGFWLSSKLDDNEIFSDFTPWDELGKSAFLSYEEAEAALRGAEV